MSGAPSLRAANVTFGQRCAFRSSDGSIVGSSGLPVKGASYRSEVFFRFFELRQIGYLLFDANELYRP